jgi:hypothetical protein
MIYTIKLKYDCEITKVVEANDEGEALDKARNLAEDADMQEYTLLEEKESQIINQR